jgi:hypothetical protein
MTTRPLYAIDRSIAPSGADLHESQTLFGIACDAATQAGVVESQLVCSIGAGAVARTFSSHRRSGGDIFYGTDVIGAFDLADRLGAPYDESAMTVVLYSPPSVYWDGSDLVVDTDDPPLRGGEAFDAALRRTAAARELSFVLLRHPLNMGAMRWVKALLEPHDVEVDVLDAA